MLHAAAKEGLAHAERSPPALFYSCYTNDFPPRITHTQANKPIHTPDRIKVQVTDRESKSEKSALSLLLLTGCTVDRLR